MWHNGLTAASVPSCVTTAWLQRVCHQVTQWLDCSKCAIMWHNSLTAASVPSGDTMAWLQQVCHHVTQQLDCSKCAFMYHNISTAASVPSYHDSLRLMKWSAVLLLITLFSTLKQIHCTSHVFSACQVIFFSVSIIHQPLIWTTGSLTCVNIFTCLCTLLPWYNCKLAGHKKTGYLLVHTGNLSLQFFSDRL